MFSLPPAASSMVKTNKLVDDNDENESVIIDCQLVEFLKDEILSQSTNVPREFIMRVVMLLNRGSVLSTGTAARGTWLFCWQLYMPCFTLLLLNTIHVFHQNNF